jgi:hypothetical protein
LTRPIPGPRTSQLRASYLLIIEMWGCRGIFDGAGTAPLDRFTTSSSSRTVRSCCTPRTASISATSAAGTRIVHAQHGRGQVTRKDGTMTSCRRIILSIHQRPGRYIHSECFHPEPIFLPPPLQTLMRVGQSGGHGTRGAGKTSAPRSRRPHSQTAHRTRGWWCEMGGWREMERPWTDSGRDFSPRMISW